MDGKAVNIEVIRKVALGLQELRQRMVFVGGATLSLYADDPAADAVRPTSDIDLSVSLAGYGEWSLLQERLQELKFYPDPESKVILELQCFTGDFFQAAIAWLYRSFSYWQGVR